MRIVYYTRTGFLEAALSFARELSRRAELHLIVELAPDSWQTNLFNLQAKRLRSGIVPADSVLLGHFPEGAQAYWRDLASFNFVVYNAPRSVHPSAWYTSYQAIRFVKSLAPDVVHLDAPSLRTAWAVPAYTGHRW